MVKADSEIIKSLRTTEYFNILIYYTATSSSHQVHYGLNICSFCDQH